MSRNKRVLASFGLVGLSGLAVLAVAAAGDNAPAPRSPSAARQPFPNQPQGPGVRQRKDMTKEAIEGPAKAVIGASSARMPAAGPAFVNPKVEPGKIRWHADFAAACAASAKSKKPVLLFQMMGRLDEKFC
jgi:hypothetical protein